MDCSKCGAQNFGGAKFCDACGTILSQGCPGCGASNRAGARFCNACGAALDEAAGGVKVSGPAQPAAAAASAAIAAPIIGVSVSAESDDVSEGERKLVTALFADIKGSTELMEDLDPEDARRVIDPALKIMIEAVNRYDGYVVQSTGDGIFALFGAPIAHEDHPQRAVLTALRMQQEIKRLTNRLRAEGHAPLQIRIGLNTGEVVVRPIQTGAGQVEYTPIGHTANLASRMQTLADPGSVVTSETTHRLCQGYFAFKALGPVRVKGLSGPVNVYEVTGVGPLRTRLQRSAGRGLTKFVGREREMDAMRRALELVKQGRGQIVAAIGEAGLGKSRLFHEFKATSQSGCLVLETFSVSHGKASPYLPVIELLNNYFEIEAEDDARKRREKVTGKVLTLDRILEDALPLLFALLGVEEAAGDSVQMDAQARRRRTLEAIKRILLRESLNQPLIVIFEDLHWIDAETQALLDLIADAIGNARVLLLLNYRPEYRHGWGSKTYYARLRLDPLGQESAEELLGALLGNEASLQPLKRLIFAKTNGNPFFMEETVQVLLDDGVLVRNGTVKLTKPLSELDIPPTVQVILASRIDRLPPDEKDLLQTLAVMGKEFPLGLIKKVTDKSDDELERMLGDLQLGEFIYEQPALPDVEYTFKHSLTLEVAYNSVLSERRRALHERTAAAIESLYGDRLDDHLAELAHQYRRGGNLEKAIEYLCRAGEQAAARGADNGAIAQLGTALELISKLPDEQANRLQEIRLRILIGPSLMAVKGQGSSEVGANYTRALELCRLAGDTSALFEALSGLWVFRLLRAELRDADALAQQLLASVSESEDDSRLAYANFAAGDTAFWRGQLVTASEHLALAIGASKSGTRPSPVFVDDPAMISRAYAAWTQHCRGYPDQALMTGLDCIRVAQALSHPRAMAMAAIYAGQLLLLRREPDAAIERCRTATSLADQHGLSFYLFFAQMLAGCAAVQRGEGERGVEAIKRGFDAWQGLGSALGAPWFLGEFAAGLCSIGRYDEALEVVRDALGRSEESGDRQFAPELRRIAGVALAAQGKLVEAESSLQRAIEIARTQSARMWELRATARLARLLDQQGRRGQARAMLAGIYGWFTEGFDIADLKDARALLDELAV
jgi:class 3 adenylate cyclase/tetratricopeptide (TPR) repeat protein